MTTLRDIESIKKMAESGRISAIDAVILMEGVMEREAKAYKLEIELLSKGLKSNE